MVVVEEPVSDPAHLVVRCHGLVVCDAADRADQGEQLGPPVAVRSPATRSRKARVAVNLTRPCDSAVHTVPGRKASGRIPRLRRPASAEPAPHLADPDQRPGRRAPFAHQADRVADDPFSSV